MAEQNPFRQKTIPAMQPAKQGILEELNVPEPIVKVLRANMKALQIAAAAVLVFILAYNAFGYYKENQREKSVALLSASMEEPVKDEKVKKLSALVEEYPSSGAADWARIELGHNAVEDGRYDDAIKLYTAVLDKVGGSSSLVPLVTYNLAVAYEGKEELDKALASYVRLEKVGGFSEISLLGQGRIFEKKGEGAKALEVYKKAKESDKLSVSEKEWVEYRLSTLQ